MNTYNKKNHPIKPGQDDHNPQITSTYQHIQKYYAKYHQFFNQFLELVNHDPATAYGTTGTWFLKTANLIFDEGLYYLEQDIKDERDSNNYFGDNIQSFSNKPTFLAIVLEDVFALVEGTKLLFQSHAQQWPKGEQAYFAFHRSLIANYVSILRDGSDLLLTFDCLYVAEYDDFRDSEAYDPVYNPTPGLEKEMAELHYAAETLSVEINMLLEYLEPIHAQNNEC